MFFWKKIKINSNFYLMASVTAAMSASESSSSEVLVLSMVSASSLSNSCSPAIEGF